MRLGPKQLVASDSDWLFISSHRSVSWISNSAIYTPHSGETYIYDGDFKKLRECITSRPEGSSEMGPLLAPKTIA
jgi:hypothetical protein